MSFAPLRALSDPALPAIIAHRGASGYRPEHTLSAYRLAIELGADYIEPDLVSTRDGVLVARHENEISQTTDVSRRPEFTNRRTTKTVDGIEMDGWFTEDFTLAELKSLRARERLPELRAANTRRNGRYRIPTFGEILDLVRWETRRHRRPIGVYPETKHPTYFRELGLALEPALVRILESRGFDRPGALVVVQSFEPSSLQMLRTLTQSPLVQLIRDSGAPYDLTVPYADLVTTPWLQRISGYADAIGPEKSLVIPRDSAGNLGTPTSLVIDAHAAGLAVHAYTFRDENAFLPADARIGNDPAVHGNAESEYSAFFRTAIDGVFSDNTDSAVAARASLTPSLATPLRSVRQVPAVS